MGLGQADKERLSYLPRREGGTGFERKQEWSPLPTGLVRVLPLQFFQGTNPKMYHSDIQGHLGLGDRQRHSKPRTDITEILRVCFSAVILIRRITPWVDKMFFFCCCCCCCFVLFCFVDKMLKTHSEHKTLGIPGWSGH